MEEFSVASPQQPSVVLWGGSGVSAFTCFSHTLFTRFLKEVEPTLYSCKRTGTATTLLSLQAHPLSLSLSLFLPKYISIFNLALSSYVQYLIG